MGSIGKPAVLNLIGTTLSRGFRLYTPLDRGLREAGFQFFFMAMVFSVLLTASLCYTAWYFGLYPTGFNGSPDRFTNYVAAFHGMDICAGYMVLCISQFAIVMRSDMLNKAGTTTFRGVMNGLTTDTWSSFFFAALFLFVLHLILFSSLMDLDASFGGIFGSWRFNTEDGATVLDQYELWAFGLADELMRYMPYLLGVYLLKPDAKSDTPITLRAALPAFVATVILAFCIEALYTAIITVMQDVIFPAFTIPFQGSFFPMVFGLILTALIGGYFLPLIALCLYQPLDILSQKGDGKTVLDRWNEIR